MAILLISGYIGEYDQRKKTKIFKGYVCKRLVPFLQIKQSVQVNSQRIQYSRKELFGLPGQTLHEIIK